jgi:hypothetical protein
MPAVRIELNRRLERDLERSGVLTPALQDLADAVEAEAKALARAEAYESGDYERSIEAEVGPDERGDQVVRLRAEDWKAHFIEFGYTQRNGVFILGRAILRRAAEQAGCEWLGWPPEARSNEPAGPDARRRTGRHHLLEDGGRGDRFHQRRPYRI